MISKILSWLYQTLEKSFKAEKELKYRKSFDIHETARLNHIENIWIKGNIKIGQGTYINSGRIISGPNSRVEIGDFCAIGHNVNIISWTHDIEKPTGPIEDRPTIEKDIIIEEKVWIGSNVFIKEGVTIRRNSIIAANSVVTKDVEEGAIYAGVPSKLIKFKPSYDRGNK